ncbi:MAG: class I SAM-dependent methyltransferase [Bdellovibrionaceae bacterium]|nr:class I SAM-dependent methyltransferase [Pseudobdellovibrionaceae bacterium]
MSMIFNRLEKNWRRLSPWAKRNSFEAWRLYDRDIPEFPFLVDIYGDHVVVYDKSDPVVDADKEHLPALIQAAKTITQVDDSRLVIKRRQKKLGKRQYEKLANTCREIPIQEGPLKFLVNLWDYLDTGLFLDHRPLRIEMRKISPQTRFLNLFSYTGTMSVAAASAGAVTTSVDLSKTYLDWAKRNFALNGIDMKAHGFVQMDALTFLRTIGPRDTFDVIYVDPPTFSNSKKMHGTWDVERDQVELLRNCSYALAPGGRIYFSTNKRKFRLAKELDSIFEIEEITEVSIPEDFHDKKIHQAWQLQKRRQN